MSLDEAEGGMSTDAYGGGWLADDPSGWQNLRNKLLDQYPGSEISAVYDNDKKVLKVYKIAVAKNLRGKGFGSEIMDSIADWADSVQALIVLTPSTDFGGTSVNRLRRFYKRFGFVDNAGRKKDFSVSDTMYRKPQE
jgi:GNAT superfamily N-acetyltransferase